MIGIDGKYIFKFSIGDKEDFIMPNELRGFTMVENAGNILPTFEMTFESADETILSYLNEGNPIKVSFGRSADDMVDVELMKVVLEVGHMGDLKYTFRIVGIMNSMGYLSSSNKFISTNKSGVETINEIVSKYFKFVSNISKSEDSQIWINPSLPDRNFVNELWLHSYKSNSFIATGITSGGEFVLSDIKTLVSTPYKWRFISEVKDTKKDVTFDGDIIYKSDTGFINKWMGYGREQILFDLDNGGSQVILEDPTPFLSLIDKVDRNASVESRLANSGFLNENVHLNYWNAYLRNLIHLATFSTTSTVVSFPNEFKPIKILDLVMLMDESIQPNKQSSSENLSGLFLTSKIVRTLSNNNLSTVVYLNRESLNSIKGDLK